MGSAPSKLNADHRRALAEVVEAGPVPAVDGVVRWRRKDLARWLLETFAISLDETTVELNQNYLCSCNNVVAR